MDEDFIARRQASIEYHAAWLREAAAQRLRDYRAGLPPQPQVGKPCPEHVALDQGADRCPVMGESLNNYWCSRPAEHDGPHIATEGDAPGAEVLAVRAE